MRSMKNKLLILLTFLFSNIVVLSQELKIVLPENDSVKTVLSAYRIAGSVPQRFRVYNNGKELKVYQTGAFVDYLKLEYGINKFKLIAISPTNDTIIRTLTFFREEPKSYYLKDTIAIIKESIQPKNDLWLSAGDILEISFIASPNLIAFVENIKMSETLIANEKNYYSIYRANIFINHQSSEIFNLKIFNDKNEPLYQYQFNNIKIISSPQPILGEILKDNAYFNTSIGGDRLGGEKFHFTEKGIRFLIDGKKGAFYRAKLSSSLSVWIDTGFVKLLEKNSKLPYSIMGNFSFYSDNDYDFISIAANSKVPYWSYYDLENNKLIVDLFYLQSNSNWQVDRYSSRMIDFIQTYQIETNVVRFEIAFKEKQLWGYTISYSGNALQIKIKHPPKKYRFKDLRIAVDAGHGADNLGALGSTGAYEKDINLSIAKYLSEMLRKKGAQVLELRPNDSLYILNSARVEEAKKFDSHIVISIHCNSIAESSDPLQNKGTSCYFKHYFCRDLAKKIYDRNLKLGLDKFGLVGNFNFALNAPTDFISVLVETAFMSNPEDEALLLNPKFQKKIAEAIVDGIDDFLSELD